MEEKEKNRKKKEDDWCSMMWWIKSGLPVIGPTASDLRHSPSDTCQNIHGKEHLLGQKHRYGANLRPSGMKISRLNGIKNRHKKIADVMEGQASTGNC